MPNSKLPQIFIGSDHGGFDMKAFLIDELKKNNYEVQDCGCFSIDSVDYPDIADLTCKKVLEKKDSLGILLCGTGIGMSISANKIKGIRAALCTHAFESQMSRNHNNANVLCLGARVIGQELAKSILNTFLKHDFEAGRHERRVNKIMNLED